MYLRSQYIVKNSWATSQTPLIDFIYLFSNKPHSLQLERGRDETIRKSEQNQGLCPTEIIFFGWVSIEEIFETYSYKFRSYSYVIWIF